MQVLLQRQRQERAAVLRQQQTSNACVILWHVILLCI
jgi:hypothetical protein